MSLVLIYDLWLTCRKPSLDLNTEGGRGLLKNALGDFFAALCHPLQLLGVNPLASAGMSPGGNYSSEPRMLTYFRVHSRIPTP